MPGQRQLTFSISDTRTVTIPVPSTPTDVLNAGDFIRTCGQQGYSLKAAVLNETVRANHRDPYVVGVRLVFERTGNG